MTQKKLNVGDREPVFKSGFQTECKVVGRIEPQPFKGVKDSDHILGNMERSRKRRQQKANQPVVEPKRIWT